MIGHIVLCCYNNVALSAACLKTLLAQNVACEILIVDNASTDGTAAWSRAEQHKHSEKFKIISIHRMTHREMVSVSSMWNQALRWFWQRGAEEALVVNADTELRPDTYRWLREDGGPFVTAVGVNQREQVGEPTDVQPDPARKRKSPDFSCYMIRRECYETVGPFDENFHGAYAEDWDMHVRLHKAGITAWCLDLPYLHHGAGTIKNSPPAEVKRIQKQADRNRQYFAQKWGVHGGTRGYYAIFDKPVTEAGPGASLPGEREGSSA